MPSHSTAAQCKESTVTTGNPVPVLVSQKPRIRLNIERPLPPAIQPSSRSCAEPACCSAHTKLDVDLQLLKQLVEPYFHIIFVLPHLDSTSNLEPMRLFRSVVF